MTKTYASIKQIIIDKLTALQGSGSQALFVAVYGSNVTEPDGYPIAYVIEKKGDGKITDTARNQRTWEFSVVVHYSLSNKTGEVAYSALLDAVDRVLAMFDADPMLADSHGQEQCKKVEVAPVEIERVVQDAAVIRALINVRVVDLVARY